MNLSHAFDILSRRDPRRIAVLGDVILDKWIWGVVDRISPEAPVPVLDLKDETYTLGGAGNVAANIRCLGPEVDILGVTGTDTQRDRLVSLVEKHSIRSTGLLPADDRPTTTKTRVVAHSQQIVRIDREKRSPLPDGLRGGLVDYLAQIYPELDALVVSDYGKGVVMEAVLDGLRALLTKRPIPILVDPKNPNFSVYRGFTVVAPNHAEAAMGAGFKITDDLTLVEAGYKIRSSLGLEGVLITRGAQGMSLFQKGREVLHIPTRARNVFDVTGAGDTVMAVLAVGLANGLSLEECAHLANYGAGVAVGKVGTATVTLEEIGQAIRVDAA